jgi:DNA uptake protein ComE-like DNA-binding protein
MSFWKSYFQFTRREKNGILLLIILILIIWLFYFTYLYFHKDENYDFSNFEQQLKSFYNSIEIKNTDTIIKKIKNSDSCFVFINNPKYEDLICIGLNEKLSKTWINYISKGGTFKSINDVKKLWGMTDSIFNSIANKLLMDTIKKFGQNKKVQNFTEKDNKHIKKIKLIELNTTDTNELKDLPYIGSSFANRIVKYRNRLGGFVAKEQLKEIYGLTEDIFDKIAPYVYVDVFEAKKIPINKADYYTLIQHPYLNKEKVKALLKLRKEKGTINSKEELLRNEIFTSEEWERIKWYIDFQ